MLGNAWTQKMRLTIFQHHTINFVYNLKCEKLDPAKVFLLILITRSDLISCAISINMTAIFLAILTIAPGVSSHWVQWVASLFNFSAAICTYS